MKGSITMTKNTIKIFPVLTALLTGNVFAVGVPVTHQFQGGQPASASQVNENFQELADRIADIPNTTIYDYRLYLSTVSSKTFSIVASNATCDAETQSYSRTRNGDITLITIDRLFTDNSAPCGHDIRYYTATPERYEQTAVDYVDINNPSLFDHYRYQPARVIAITPMTPGHRYSFHNQAFYTPYGGSESPEGTGIRDLVVVGIEDITVPAGQFNNCLKIRQDNFFGATATQRLTWRCPVVGEVKYVHRNGSSSTVKELTSYTP